MNLNPVLLDVRCSGSLSVPRETRVTLRGDENFVYRRFDDFATSAKPFGAARVVTNARFAKGILYIFPIRDQARGEPDPLLGYIAALQDVIWRQDHRAAEGCGLSIKNSPAVEDITLISIQICRGVMGGFLK